MTTNKTLDIKLRMIYRFYRKHITYSSVHSLYDLYLDNVNIYDILDFISLSFTKNARILRIRHLHTISLTSHYTARK